MREFSRTQNSARNFVLGTGMYIFTQLASFVSRTVFIKLLGEQYLGISGLYSNILALLALADLGVTTAFTFALYKPLSEKDYKKVGSLLSFFKKMFILISLIVLLIGFAFIPFLKYIIKDSTLEYNKLQLYFALSVINSACSYLSVYKSAVFRADQKVYIVNEVSAITNLILHILQILFLYATKNYIFYLLVTIFVTLLNNIILTFLANKSYPLIFNQEQIELPKAEKKKIFDNLKSLIVYRISAAIMNSTTNVLISIILGTVIVGYYSNYSMILAMITAIINILANALLASIGNYGISGKIEKRSTLFHTIMLLFYGIGAFCSACFICLFNDFIYIWLKNDIYLLPNLDVYLIVFSFFITCVSNPIWMFRESLGLFKQAKYIMLIAAVLNIFIAIIGGIFLGVGGIVMATGLSRILTMFWFEPRYLYREAFKCKYREYWKHSAKYFFQSIIVICISILVSNFLAHNIFNMLLKLIFCFIITLIVFGLLNLKTKEGYILIDKLKSIFKKNKKNIK